MYMKNGDSQQLGALPSSATAISSGAVSFFKRARQLLEHFSNIKLNARNIAKISVQKNEATVEKAVKAA